MACGGNERIEKVTACVAVSGQKRGIATPLTREILPLSENLFTMLSKSAIIHLWRGRSDEDKDGSG